MIAYKALHWALGYSAQFQFILVAKALYYILKLPGYRTGKVDRLLPALAIFQNVVVEEVIQTVLNNVLHHKVTAILS